MKKLLSVILTIVMLAQTAVFAAPSAVTSGDEAVEMPEVIENTDEFAELFDVAPVTNKKGSDFTNNSQIASKLDKLFNLLPYSSYPYFTTYGNKTCGNSSCDYCNVKNVVTTHPNLKNLGLDSSKVSGWSCFGFAQFAYYYIFGRQAGEYGTASQKEISTLKRVVKVQNFDLDTCKNALAQARAGDIIQGNGSGGSHTVIFLGCDSTFVWVLQNNYFTGDYGKNRVSVSGINYTTFVKNYNTAMSVYRCPDYPEGTSGGTSSDLSVGDFDAVQTYNGHIYRAYLGTYTWTQAKDYCSKFGGHLVTITDSTEQSWVSTIPTYLGGTYWIGAYRSGSSMYWVTGEPFSYSNWDDGEPSVTSASGVAENCVGMYGDDTDSKYATPGKWNDFSETSGTVDGFICEWDPDKYTVSYNANGGSGAPSSQTKYHGTNLTLSSTKPTRTGYTFKGWATSSSGSVSYYAGSTYSSNSSVTLYAVWEANTYTVSYNANGGSGAPSSQTKYHGTNLTLSSTKPTRTGYTFKGWATSSSGSVSYYAGSTYSSNSSVTLYAVWEANTYTVSYNANGGSGAPSSQTKTYGVNLTLRSTTPTRAGYTFKGWATSSSGSVSYYAGSTYSSNSSVTLYAVWEANTCTVTFDPNGGSVSPTSKTVTYGSTYGELPVATKTGYNFNGWTENLSESTIKFIKKDDIVEKQQDHTLFAVWTRNGYTVTFDANGGSFGNGSTTYKKTVFFDDQYGEWMYLNPRTGYTLIGWSIDKNSSTASITKDTIMTIPESHTVYAVWQFDAVSVNGVSLSKTAATLKIGETLTLTATINPEDATNQNVTWTSSDETVATVEDGTVTAVGEGTATITVTTEDGGKSATCIVTVTKPEEEEPDEPELPEEPDEDVKAFYTISEVTARAGDTVEVTVSLKTEEAFKGVGVASISYDEKVLTLDKATIADDIKNVTFMQNFDKSNMTFVAAASEETEGFEGKLFTLTFKINEEALAGEYGISGTASTTLDDAIKSFLYAGKVIVIDEIPGDVNLDDRVNSDDAVLLLQNILFPKLYPISYKGSVDFNGDGKVTTDDAIRLLQHAMFPSLYPLNLNSTDVPSKGDNGLADDEL